MKFIEDIVISVDDLISFEIEGLPTNESSFRRFLKREGWPIVYTDIGKYLILIEAIPEPFNSKIQYVLSVRRSASPAEFFPPTPEVCNPALYPARVRVEARLTVIFEVIRRSYQVGGWNAARGFVNEANALSLPSHLQHAAIMAVERGGSDAEYLLRRYAEKSSNLDQNRPEEGSWRSDKMSYAVISLTSILRWADVFNKYGVTELEPGSVSLRIKRPIRAVPRPKKKRGVQQKR
jgi:hypothetical protein